ncbi:MAG: DNA double-strand break repair nuclease NurA [Thermosphaera sp.]
MRDYLLELALRRWNKISTYINTISLEDYREIAKRLWMDYKPVSRDVESFIAVDGSSNLLNLRDFSVYSVIGYGVEKTSKGIAQRMVGDIGVLAFPRTSDIARVLREICELKTALMSDQERVLVDGSLTSLLINPEPMAGFIKFEDAYAGTIQELGEEVFDELWSRLRVQVEELKESTVYYEDPFVSRLILENKNIDRSTGEMALVLLVFIEKLLSLRILLEKTVGKEPDGSVVFISKTSRSKLYYERFIKQDLSKASIAGGKTITPSDMSIFGELIINEGFSRPIILEEVGFVKTLPSKGVLKSLIGDFYSNVGLILSYVRLLRGGPVVKLEIPFSNKYKMDEDKAAAIVKNVVDHIYPLSYNGYPYPLLQADKLSKITRDDIIAIAYTLKVLPHWSGREVLGEWVLYYDED